jgi:hypothetical protein
MLNMSKYHKAIVGCSAIVTASIGGFVQSASAAEQFQDRNVRLDRGTILIAQTNNCSTCQIPTPANPPIRSSQPATNLGGGNNGISVRAASINSQLSLAQTNYDNAATALAQAEAAQPTASNTSPVRYALQSGDLASCGCPNADTTVGANTTPRPELIAAKAAEAEAAAELAAAKAEARQFLESVKSSGGNVGAGVSSPLW